MSTIRVSAASMPARWMVSSASCSQARRSLQRPTKVLWEEVEKVLRDWLDTLVRLAKAEQTRLADRR
jgi:hypothetical protein